MFTNLLFGVSTLLILACCGLMLWTKNIMHACIFLLGTLIGMAGLYATLGADFVAVTQIMVYVGGVVILMLFAVMLTGGKDFVSKTQKLKSLIPPMGNTTSYILGSVTALVFLLTQVFLVSKLLGSVEASKPVDTFSPTVQELGELLITDHVLPFELSSVLLLGALVGAAIIARPRKARPKFEPEVEEHH